MLTLNCHNPTGCTAKAELLNYLGNPAAPAAPPKDEPSSMEVDSDASAAPSAAAATLTALVDDVKSGVSTPTPKKEGKEKEEEKELGSLPEGDVYISLLVVLWLLDQGQYAQVSSTSCKIGRRESTLMHNPAGQATVPKPPRLHHLAQPPHHGSALEQGLLLLGQAA